MPPVKSQEQLVKDFHQAHADLVRAQQELVEASDRKREAAVGLYNHKLSYEQVGAALGLSTSRVWQIINPDKAKVHKDVQEYKTMAKALKRSPRTAA